jgi:hypothetical protein
MKRQTDITALAFISLIALALLLAAFYGYRLELPWMTFEPAQSQTLTNTKI